MSSKQEQWIRYYRAAEAFYDLAPWRYLYESDIFGVKSVKTKKKYFVSIMGSEGEFRGLTAYEGTDALGQYWLLHDRGMTESADALTIQHIILSFETDKQADKDQVKKLKDSGYPYKFSNAWPEIKRVIPGLVPIVPEDDNLDDFITVLEQAVSVCKKAAKDPACIHSDNQDADTYLIRELSGGKSPRWTNKYRKININEEKRTGKCKEKDLQTIASLPKGNVVMQAHYQMVPFPMKEKDGPAYFPVLTLLTNKKSKNVEANELISPLPDYKRMTGNMAQVFCAYIIGLGFRPRCIEVMNPGFYDMLNDTLGECGVHVVMKNRLESIEEATDRFMNSVVQRR